jgi:hypothetical protein
MPRSEIRTLPAITKGYFFFPAADLAAAAALFCALALLALDCFCEDFFWLDFGDLSPIIFFFRWLIGRRNFSFSAGIAILLAATVIVNNRCENILAGIYYRGIGAGRAAKKIIVAIPPETAMLSASVR